MRPETPWVLPSTRDDGGPPVLLDHHPAAAFVVLEIGPITVPCSDHAIVAERGLAVRHARIGRADHGVSAGRAHDERGEQRALAEIARSDCPLGPQPPPRSRMQAHPA